MCACRQRRAEEAAQYAQQELAPLRGRLHNLSKEYDEMLHDVMALIAYEDPEVSASLHLSIPLLLMCTCTALKRSCIWGAVQ